METSERALSERIVRRGERFPVGVSGPPGLHLIVEEGSINSLSPLSSACLFLFVHSGRGRQPTYMKRRRGGFLDIKVSRWSKILHFSACD